MRRNLVTCIASLLLAACSEEKVPAPLESGARFEAAPSEERRVDPGVRYADVTEASGIDFVHVNGAFGKKYLPETMGSGVGMLDVDGDGDLDLFFVQSCYWPGHEPEGAAPPTLRLYRNEGGWRFTDATTDAGLAGVSVYGMGCAIADYDADGDPDVYVTCLGPDLLLRNDGGRFVRVEGGPDGGTWTEEAPGAAGTVTHPRWSTGAAWLDADEDGDLDLLVLGYVQWSEGRDVYTQVVEGIKAYTRPQLYEGDRPRLYLQEDGGRFRDATEGSGLDRTRVPGKSLAVCVDDFDGDGHLDLFVANDTVQNFLFLGHGDGTYEERAVAAAVAYDDNGRARAAMGIDAQDWRNDGRLAVAIGNFSEEPVSLFTAEAARTGVIFKDDAASARIGRPTLLPLTFGLAWVDADLDGWCDLVLANGHIEPSMPQLKPELQYEQAPQLFRNLRGERFADVSLDAGPPFQQRLVARGLAAGDLDGDGDLDLVFTANHGRAVVLRCDPTGSNRVLRLRLRQPGTRNPDAVGAVARVTAGGTTQRRIVRTGGSYLSQGDPVLTFGLGAADRADEVVVRWPDGTEQRFGPVPAGATPHTIERKP